MTILLIETGPEGMLSPPRISFRMWHESKNQTGRVADPRDMTIRTVGIVVLRISDGDLSRVHEMPELVTRHESALAMGDRQK